MKLGPLWHPFGATPASQMIFCLDKLKITLAMSSLLFYRPPTQLSRAMFSLASVYYSVHRDGVTTVLLLLYRTHTRSLYKNPGPYCTRIGLPHFHPTPSPTCSNLSNLDFPVPPPPDMFQVTCVLLASEQFTF